METIKKIKDYIIKYLHILYKHKYITVTVIFVVIITLLSDHNLIEHIKNKNTISKLEKEIVVLEKEIGEYEEKLSGLSNDERIIEKVAREEYGMHAANEEVFIIEQKTEEK